MSESDTWSARDEADAAAWDAPPVAEQMKAATRSLRAHLSLVRDPDEPPRPARG